MKKRNDLYVVCRCTGIFEDKKDSNKLNARLFNVDTGTLLYLNNVSPNVLNYGDIVICVAKLECSDRITYSINKVIPDALVSDYIIVAK